MVFFTAFPRASFDVSGYTLPFNFILRLGFLYVSELSVYPRSAITVSGIIQLFFGYNIISLLLGPVSILLPNVVKIFVANAIFDGASPQSYIASSTVIVELNSYPFILWYASLRICPISINLGNK